MFSLKKIFPNYILFISDHKVKVSYLCIDSVPSLIDLDNLISSLVRSVNKQLRYW